MCDDFGESRSRKGKFGRSYDWNWDSWGKGKDGGKGKGKSRFVDEGPGKLLIEKRVQATVKSYSPDSGWGFSRLDPEVEGEFGDIFLHAKNFDDHMDETGTVLRVGDVVELTLEELGGRPMARQISMVAQDPSVYDTQWLRGPITAYNEDTGTGTISCSRVWGDISFSKEELPSSMQQGGCDCVDTEVMFCLMLDDSGAKAKCVNSLDDMDEYEAVGRTTQIVELMKKNNQVDETAGEALKSAMHIEVIALIADLDFYKAENKSSYIYRSWQRISFPKMDFGWYGPWGMPMMGKGGKDISGAMHRQKKGKGPHGKGMWPYWAPWGKGWGPY